MKTIAALTPAQVLCGLLAVVCAEHQRIVPELDPVSSPKFMKQDYPDDRRAKVYHKFDYPYPTVQDGEDYDKDYVQDKNDDNGYWKNQMEYDRLKNVLQKEMDELKKALAKLMKERKELEDAIKREAESERRAGEAEGREKAADAAHGKLQADIANKDAEIDGAVDKVGAEITDLEECKRQLKEARAKLKALQDEKAKRLAEKQAKDKAEEGAEEKEVAAELTEAELEKSLDEAKKDYIVGQKAYEKALAEVKAAEVALAKQAGILRGYMKDAVDPDGGVYWVKKKESGWFGGSVTTGLSAALLAAIVGLQLL